ncbi:MAG: hypothetical protein ACM31L_11225 [Actinomycetota bacterium]
MTIDMLPIEKVQAALPFNLQPKVVGLEGAIRVEELLIELLAVGGQVNLQLLEAALIGVEELMKTWPLPPLPEARTEDERQIRDAHEERRRAALAWAPRRLLKLVRHLRLTEAKAQVMLKQLSKAAERKLAADIAAGNLKSGGNHE